VVHDGRALACLPSAFGAADVRCHLLDTIRDITLARACDGAHPHVPARELADNRRARAARGSDDDVIAAHVHDVSLGRTTAQRTSGMRERLQHHSHRARYQMDAGAPSGRRQGLASDETQEPSAAGSALSLPREGACPKS